MPKSVIVLFLALAAPGLAKEPYRPLPRLSADEVKRRKAEAPPAGPSAPPDEPSASAPTEPPPIATGAPAAPDRLPPGPDAAQPATPPTLEAFREGLSPYGSWAWSKEHGWIWRPRVGAGWKPYYRGQWVWTDAGWTWTSDEPWAWATYHYGRWAYDPGAGWFWVPGYQWAPAWVTWRVGEGVVGWAPLWPGWPFSSVGFAPSFRLFTFVPSHRFHGLPVHRFAVPPRFLGGPFPRTYSAAPPPPMMARGPAWSGPRGFGTRPAFGGGLRGGPMGRHR
jgi:hypothetical protein